MRTSFGRTELPEEQEAHLRRAVRLAWLTIAFLVTAVTDAPEAEAVVAMFSDYAEGINSEDYETAHAQLSPAHADRIPLDEFVEQQSTSVLRDLVLLDVEAAGDGLLARTAFTS